ncbi:MAG: polyprenyl synthetase family protein [Lachnospiraceae bacterium]|nr:polyprenyl synthetase family protein [Lachnospiraceae bacterium]
METFKETLVRRTREVEEIVTSYLPNEEGHQKTVLTAMNYSVLAGGKRLRPLLMQETYRLLGGNGQEIEPFMAAMEMIHTASLVHDDLPAMDGDEYRRGKKTTWVTFGEDMGILAGDALMIYAFETAAKAFSMTAHPDRVGKALEVLANKTGIYGMIGGQTVDVELTDKPIPADKLAFIYELKTGALLEASMMIGAILSGATKEQVDLVRHVASRLGLAFQIQDDILDVTSSTEVLGKPVMSDEKNHKTTYVTLFGLEKARERVKEVSLEAIGALKTLPPNDFLHELIKALITREK